jgi:hypothetical protein
VGWMDYPLRGEIWKSKSDEDQMIQSAESNSPRVLSLRCIHLCKIVYVHHSDKNKVSSTSSNASRSKF